MELYGFQRGFTMENTVYKLINVVLNDLNNEQIVGGIFVTSQRHLTVYIMKY